MKLFNECSSLITDPWNHYNIDNIFNENTLDSLMRLIGELKFKSTTNKFRNQYCFHKKNNISLVNYIIDSFLCKDNLSFLCKNDSRFDSREKLAKITVWKDLPGFSTPVHTDTPYKLMTMQIYLPTNNEKKYGTSFFDKDKNLSYTTDYNMNNGYMFFPNHNGIETWHSYNNAPIISERTSIVFHIVDKELFMKNRLNSYESLLDCIQIK
jgi:hypothetical protein